MLNKMIQRWTQRIMASRSPDVVIGDPDDPYLLRWWVFPRNKWLNLYLHRVLRSDDDRALHDHPWINMSYIVEGEYNEVMADMTRVRRSAGAFKFRLPTALHRLELIDKPVSFSAYDGDEYLGETDVLWPAPCTTLFLTGPRVRTWGFQCFKGWVDWRDFTQKTPEGTFIAKGCGDIDPKLLAATPARSGWWPKQPDSVLPPPKDAAVRVTGTSDGVVNRG